MSGDSLFKRRRGRVKRAATGQASKPVELQSPGKGHRMQSLLERGHGRPFYMVTLSLPEARHYRSMTVMAQRYFLESVGGR